jgi:hypothetical protein
MFEKCHSEDLKKILFLGFFLLSPRIAATSADGILSSKNESRFYLYIYLLQYGHPVPIPPPHAPRSLSVIYSLAFFIAQAQRKMGGVLGSLSRAQLPPFPLLQLHLPK